jgi:hypothetical protein
MNRIACVAALCLAAASTPRPAVACPSTSSEPKIELRVDAGTVEFDYSRDRAFLSDVFHRQQTATASGHMPIGLTQAKLGLEITTRTEVVRSGRSFCAYLDVVTVTVGFAVFAVFVDQRYPEGSCERKAVLDHELEHVAINRTALSNNRFLIADRLRAAAFSGPVAAESEAEARQAYNNLIDRELRPVLTLISQQAQQRHAILDAPASYAKTRSRCANW